MSSLPIDPPAARVASSTRSGHAPRLLATVLAVGVGVACGWRGRELLPGMIATGGVALGFWLGQQLVRGWLGFLTALMLAGAFLFGVKLEWESAVLQALIGTDAGLRWRNDPAPALVLAAIMAWAGVAWLLWPR